jgi:hypothetical protein
MLPLALVAYGIYWAFSIRGALAVRIYRHQALGAGLAGIGFMLIFALNAISNLGGDNSGAYGILLVYAVAVMTFFWVDASIRAARRGDPLLRETFHWERLRYALWALMVVVIGPVSTLIVLAPPSAAASGPPPLPIFIFALSPLFVIGISGLIILPRAAGRSGDLLLRRQLRWFGLFVFFGLFNFLVVNWILGGTANEVLTTSAFVVSGYCLYRSARSLVPLNRLDLGQLDSAARLKVGATRHPALSLSTHIEQSQGML